MKTKAPSFTPNSDLSMASPLSAAAAPVPDASSTLGKVGKVYQHWADGDAAAGTAAEWNNNILSANKSDYFEGEVVPNLFYYSASNKAPLVNGQSYSFDVTYNLYQANTNAGGYAYMTTYNLDRQPGTLTGATPSVDTVAADHNGGGMQGQFYTVNADVTQVSAVQTSQKGGNVDAKVTITFTYTGPTTTTGGAEVYFGLMVAQPGMVPDQGRGMTDGAAAWTGGSLQTTVEIGGTGATSIQLAPSAILVGEISGLKFEDVDGNGARDADGADNILGTADDEVGLAGWTIFLDNNHNGVLDPGERSTVTGPDGLYVFAVTPDADPSDPDNDAYWVREVQQAGWIRTTANPDPITVDALHPQHAHVDFGNQRYLPALSIQKAAVVPGGSADVAGEIVSYSISVINTGNQPLTNITVNDPFVSNLQLVPEPASSDGVLNVGEVWHYTATHAVTQAEIDAGGVIRNVAQADSAETEPVTGDASVPVEQRPRLAVDKAVAGVFGGNENGSADLAGEVIRYSILVYNPGNQTLTGVSVVDPVTGLSVGDVTLAPGGSRVYETAYTITQADMDTRAGGDDVIENTVTADSDQTAAVSDTKLVPLQVRPALSVNKVLSFIDGGNGNALADSAGDVLHYTIEVVNVGTVTLTSLRVIDALTGLDSNGRSLAPGESAVFTTGYSLTQADLDGNGGGSGYILNTATVTSDQVPSQTDTESAPLIRNVALAFDKAFVEVTGGNGNALADAAGDVLNYRFVVTNPGNVTLNNVRVQDPLTGLDQSLPTLAPGASQTLLGSYVLQQSDLDGQGGGDGVLDNAALATANGSISVSDAEAVPLVYAPRIDLTKYVSVDNGVTWVDANVGPGPTLDPATGFKPLFRFVVANVGNISLPGVELTDSKYDLNGADPGASHLFGALAVGASAEWIFDGAVFETGLQSDVATAVVVGMPTVRDVDNVYYTGGI